MEDAVWDMSEFLTRYTSKSNQQSSPLRSDDLFNESLEKDKSPLTIEGDIRVVNEEFCNERNLEDRLKFLNQELSMLGFTPIISNCKSSHLLTDINENFDVTKLVNCTYELLRRQHQQAKAKNELESKQIRSEHDNEYLVQTQGRLKQDVENLKREAALLLCREKEQIDKCCALQQELKAEREDKRKMRADVDHLKKQFYHESKRTEKEITRLKEKIHQALKDKSQDRKIGIDILNSLQRADGKRSTWNTAGKKREEEMYKLVISNYEDKEKILQPQYVAFHRKRVLSKDLNVKIQGILSENISMRDLINELQNMLSPDDTSINNEATEEGTINEFQMPFYLVKNDIEEKLKAMISSLREKAKHRNKADSTTTTVEDESFTNQKSIQNTQVERGDDELLLNKIEHFKAIISGQEKIIQSMKDGYSIEAFESILKTFGNEEEDRVERREKLMKEQEKKFNEERKQFTDYVLKLSKEKEEFEKERVDFYMKCLSTPNLKKDKLLHKAHHHGKENQPNHLQSVTPCFSPAKRPSMEKIATPSTAELYKFMSMSYDSGIAKSAEKSSSFDGSFVQYDAVDNSNSNDPSSPSPSSRKLKEHVEKVRKAVEEKHNKSHEEERMKTGGK